MNGIPLLYWSCYGCCMSLLGYAFIIEAFEYDTETQVLNFDAAIVGEHNVPYSKVFLNKRGVGNKFVSSFYEYADIYLIYIQNELDVSMLLPFTLRLSKTKTPTIIASAREPDRIFEITSSLLIGLIFSFISYRKLNKLIGNSIVVNVLQAIFEVLFNDYSAMVSYLIELYLLLFLMFDFHNHL